MGTAASSIGVVADRGSNFGLLAPRPQQIITSRDNNLVGQRSIYGQHGPRKHERAHHLRIERYGAIARRLLCSAQCRIVLDNRRKLIKRSIEAVSVASL